MKMYRRSQEIDMDCMSGVLMIKSTHSVTHWNLILFRFVNARTKTAIEHCFRVHNSRPVYTLQSTSFESSAKPILVFEFTAPVHQMDFLIAWSQGQLDFYEYMLEMLMLLELEHVPIDYIINNNIALYKPQRNIRKPGLICMILGKYCILLSLLQMISKADYFRIKHS